MITLIDKLNNKIKEDDYFLDENKEIIKEKVKTASLNLDDHLMSILLEDEDFKSAFFIEKNGILVFDKVKFSWIINNIDFLPNSYTSYKNKIGLVDSNGDFLKSKDDVVLVFPYKDCVLEFDSTSEDESRPEIFLNEYLSIDYIDNLFSHKVLTNAKLHSKNELKTTSTFNNENLIIKGNNLIAMHSLLKKYPGKIKLMYWDVLYNTESDNVPYNDSFKHSSYLTMMKNRLDVAKKLLSNDGCIFIQCDDNEQAYLKVLCDEIFGRENFVNCIAVKMSEASGVKMNHAKKRFPKLKEYLLFYKMKDFNGFYRIDKYKIDSWDSENNILLEGITKEDREKLIDLELKEVNDLSDMEIANEVLSKAKAVSLSTKLKELNLDSEDKINEWLFDNSYRIIKTAGSSSLANLVKSFKEIPNQDIASAVSKKGVLFFYITNFNREAKQPRLQVIFADSNIYKNPCDFWQDIKTTGAISDEGGVALSNGKKPEKLIQRIIKMTTNENDIVLDAYFGTGTTGAVAMKMKRKFIGIEQLNSHYDKCLTRLDNVINGDQTGISKEEGWHGGGSFVSVELANNNNSIIEKICLSTKDNIMEIYDYIINNPYCLNYKVDLDILKNINNRDEFTRISLDNQKRLLIELLDKNLLYINYSEIDDEEKGVSNVDKAFTKSFYGE